MTRATLPRLWHEVSAVRGAGMASASHHLSSVVLSVVAGLVFALAAVVATAHADGVVVLIGAILGAFVGLVMSPLAVFARADAECRASFLLVVAPTAVVTLVASVAGGPGVGFLASVASYGVSCAAVGVSGRWRRRRLHWYARGWCTSCGYDMTGIDTERCPECGRTARVRPKIRVAAGVLRA